MSRDERRRTGGKHRFNQERKEGARSSMKDEERAKERSARPAIHSSARSSVSSRRDGSSRSSPENSESSREDSSLQHGPVASAKLYGVAPVLEALRAGQRTIESITIADGAQHFRLRELVDLAHKSHVPVRHAPRVELERATQGANHQGVVATVAAARYADAYELLDALSSRIGVGEPPLAVVLDGVEDPRNLGAILRTAECAGAHGVFVPERRSVGLTETVAKASAGALEHVPVARVVNLVRLIEELKERNIWTIGTSAEAQTDYTAWDWTQPCAMVLGGEGTGLHRLVRERCDALVRIPLRGQISSLNVSVAAGIVLYEALRQRSERKN
ncbi:MAG: 23S rRNA (guanosine(2251)-2'-O)-methyltransferase RlmB [Pyrinomonadaceae bacterium]